MKKRITYNLVLMVFVLLSCNDDFLERYPISEIAPENFFRTENDLRLYTNGFYEAIPAGEDIYGYLQTVDDVVTIYLDDRLRGTRVVPTSGGDWDWDRLRRINIFLENSYRCEDAAARIRYDALARFFRAWFYFDKVRKFGDVPWYSTSITSDDDELLMKARDSRVLVMDSVLADIDYAIQNLGTGKSIDQVTKWTALALKSRICLFEGTFRKYHNEFGLSGADKFFDECVSASEELIAGDQYTIYRTMPEDSYLHLFASMEANDSEVILARKYEVALQQFHNVNYYLVTPSFGRPGLEKQLVNSYLMRDGSRFTDIPGYKKMTYHEEISNRDPRLTQTIRGPGYMRIGENEMLAPDFGASATGYQIVKYVNKRRYDSYNQSSNDMPVFRYGEVLLNFAEAKAEKGSITQADIDKTIKLLRDRVDMPNLNLASANAEPDPFLENQYPNVSGGNKGIILEIRRERRVELVMEGFRWWDLMRWKEGHLITRQFEGMYFPGPGEYDMDGDGTIDVIIYEGERPPGTGPQYLKLGSEILLKNGNNGNIVINPHMDKTFNEDKDYLFPIPIEERLLNPNLTQNPGWND